MCDFPAWQRYRKTYLYTVPESDDDDQRVAVRRVTVSPLRIAYIILVNQALEAIKGEMALSEESFASQCRSHFSWPDWAVGF